MDTFEADPYEQQLRALFESFDVNSAGSLDKRGLQQLCEQLPLDQYQSSDLINVILRDPSDRISFSQFWEALLSLLGGGWSSSCVQGPEKVKEKEIAIDRGESPEREVSPKLVLGQKKYGRRSRPESSELEFESFPSESETRQCGAADADIQQNFVPVFSSIESEECVSKTDQRIQCKTVKCSTNEDQTINSRESPIPLLQGSSIIGTQGSLSQAEDCIKQAWQQYGKKGFVNVIELGQVCECIGIDKLSNEALQQLFDQLDSDRDGKVSLDDFLLLFRSGVPCTPMTSSAPQAPWIFGSNTSTLSGGPSLSLTEFNGMGVATGDAIIELWESVGVTNPSLLLRDLNLDDPLRSVSVSSVAGSLEEEILRQGKTEHSTSSLPSSSEPSMILNNLLLAALTLRQTEVKWMKSSLEQMSCERDKLRNDLAEANYRASLLAQEIDDHHSKLERVSQNQFKQMEQKHSEAVRELTTHFSQEREQLTLQINRLEQKVASLQQSESKFVSEVASLRLENETLDKENRNLAEKISECEEAKLQMGKELQEIESLQQRLSELQANHDPDRVEHLYEQISKLRAENSELRDRNDELTVELEVLTSRLSNLRVRRQTSGSVDGRLKRRGNSPLVLEPTDDSGDEESPRVGKMRRCSRKVEDSLDNVHIEGLQIHPLATSESGVEGDIDFDSSENISGQSLCKISGKGLDLPSEKWLNVDSESPSLLGSQDDLVNLPSRDLLESSEQNLDVARLKARIEELEKALHLQSNKFVGSQDVKRSLKDIDIDFDNFTDEDTPSGSITSLQIYNCGEKLSQPSKGAGTSNGQAVEQLQQHCKDLETQLENVKQQIVKILSEKRACSQENCILKRRIQDLSKQLPDTCPLSGESSLLFESSDHFLSPTNTIQSEKECFQETKLLVDKAIGTSSDKAVICDCDKKCEEKIKEMERSHAKDLMSLRDQCSDLEKSLSLMRDEYERCEDYWAGKLDEERQLAEQEQRITDEKFSELMSKIREYEDLFADDYARRSVKPSDGRLETIEEQDGLEKQVVELEEELEGVRNQAMAKISEQDEEIQQLKDQIRQFQYCQITHCVNSADIAVQVSDLETRSWGSDRTFIVKQRVVNEYGPSLSVNGNSGEEAPSSTSTTSSPCSSSSPHNGEEMRDDPPGVIRRQQPRGRHRRIRHHPHYTALNCLNPDDELQAVELRLREQEETCVRLQRALRAQQQTTQTILQHSWDRHKQEMADLQIVLQCTQNKLEQQADVSREQMNRLTQSDILVKELYVENAHLIASIQNLEERCLLLLQQQVNISSTENCSSV